MRKYIFRLLGFTIPVLVGIGLIIYGIVLNAQQKRLERKWVEELAEVCYVEAVKDEKSFFGKADITEYNTYFIYTVDEVEYEGVIKDVMEYEEGDLIDVLYNPENPQRYSVNRSADQAKGGIFIIEGFFVLATCGFWIYKSFKNFGRIYKSKEIFKQLQKEKDKSLDTE